MIMPKYIKYVVLFPHSIACRGQCNAHTYPIHSLNSAVPMPIGRHDYSNHYMRPQRGRPFSSAQRFQLGQMYNYALCLFTFREIDCRLKATQRRLKLMICIIGFGRFLIWFLFCFVFFSQETRTVGPLVSAHMWTVLVLLWFLSVSWICTRKCYCDKLCYIQIQIKKREKKCTEVRWMTNNKHVYEKRLLFDTLDGPWGLSFDTKVTFQYA